MLDDLGRTWERGGGGKKKMNGKKLCTLSLFSALD